MSDAEGSVSEAEKFLRRIYAVVSERGDLPRAGQIIREAPPQALLAALIVGARALNDVETKGGKGPVPAGDGRAQVLLRRIHEAAARGDPAALGRLMKKQLETDPALIPTALVIAAVAHHGANEAKGGGGEPR